MNCMLKDNTVDMLSYIKYVINLTSDFLIWLLKNVKFHLGLALYFYWTVLFET